MKYGKIKFVEIPSRYTPVIDKLRLKKDPHYLDWHDGSYWVMEHRWDDMVDDVHIMMEEFKAENKGRIPPELILREKALLKYCQRVIRQGKGIPIIIFSILHWTFYFSGHSPRSNKFPCWPLYDLGVS